MDTNLKLKKAILKKAILVALASLSTSYTMEVSAIGLGDISVKSNIGQPLLANAKVYGMNADINDSCFSVNSSDTSAIGQVSFRLRRTSSDEGVLAITSRQSVTEPIAQLTVVNNCDTSFTRQYTLLIDPYIPTSSNTSNGMLANEASNNLNENHASSITQAISEPTAIKPKVKKDKAKKHKSQPSTAQNILASQNPVGTPAATPNKQTYIETPQDSTAVSKPRLTISGGNLPEDHADMPALKLSFESQLNTNRDSDPSAYSEEAAFADDVTVMSNRLTYLDKQISSLTEENKTLKKASGEFDAKLADAEKHNNFLSILTLILGLGLLASSYFFIAWLKRKNETLKEEKEQALWQSLEHGFETNEVSNNIVDSTVIANTNQTEAASTIITKDTADKDELDELEEFEQSPIFRSAFANRDASTNIIEEVTSVRDDAKLFLAHGRTSLALQLLQDHVVEAPRESAANWLLLLDLLAKEGKLAAFETAAAECKKYFNVNLDNYSTSASETLPDSGDLESFERISGELQTIWGTSEAITFLDKLIYNTRELPRMGFNKSLFEELVLLKEVAQEEMRNAEQEMSLASAQPANPVHLPEVVMSKEFKTLNIDAAIDSKKNLEKNTAPFEFELIDTKPKKS
ncbi:MAG: hypothetical protein WC733_03940 [Methylophilus sp.]|jgi:hypothetical protein